MKKALRPSVFCAVLLLALPRLYVTLATSRRRFSRVEETPFRPTAIVLGAGLLPNGGLTPMLADRMQAAIDLYKASRVQKLLLSGDGTTSRSEVEAMAYYALERGIPRDSLILDRLGLDTFQSCMRATQQYEVHSATLVTQRFHIARAVFIAKALHIDAIGLGTADWGNYGLRVMTRYSVREWLATIKALLRVFVPDA